jgi:type IV pilus assembly protein PilC
MLLIFVTYFLLVFYVYLGFKKPGIALITCPFVSAALFYISILEDSITTAGIAPIIFIATVVAVAISKGEADSERWPQRIAKWILIGFGILLLSVISFIFLRFGVSLGFILFISFVGFIISYIYTSRYATAAYIISTIGSSIRQNLPLAMALESAASGQTDERSRILRRIQKWLVQGYSLSESVKRGWPKCPGYAVAIITAAERIDQLPLAIKALEADMVAKADENMRVKPMHPLYPIIVIVFMFFMVFGLTTFVVPQFHEILIEMFEGAALPASTRFLVRTANFIGYEIGWLIGLALAFIIFVVAPASIRIIFRPRRPDKPYLISRISDFIKWHLPVLRWFENNYSTVQVVELLRLSLNSGGTVNDAIANTLNLDINNCFKKRLRKWLAKVEAGGNIADAAKKSRLSNSLAWAFDDKVNQGNTLAILETLESFYRSNYSYRANLVRLMMGPCITIIMGAMVGFVVYAIFSPMVAIVNYLAGSVVP